MPELTEEFEKVLERCTALVKQQELKHRLQDEMQRMYLLEWGEMKGKPDYIREVRDTQPHDAINWSVDVLSVHEPSITVELPRELPQDGDAKPTTPNTGVDMLFEQNDLGMPLPMPTAQTLTPENYDPDELSETLEGVARSAFRHNDQRRKSSLLRDFLYSAFLFDEVIAKVADLRLSALWKKSPTFIKNRSPFAIRACLPTTIYAEWDDYGLCAVLNRYKRPLREIVANYGDVSEAAKLFDADPDGNVIFCEWWTREQTAKWIERTVQVDEPAAQDTTVSNLLILEELRENTLGFIPFVIRTGRGSRLFEMDNEQINPMLYGGWKSKVFFRTNLMLTVAASLAFAMANKQWVYKTKGGDKPLDIDFSEPHTWAIGTDESIDGLDATMNRDITEAVNRFLGMSEKTTLSQVVAGQVPQGVSAAAAINLAVQGSKLTIVPAQNAVGEAYAQITQMLFDYIKAYGDSSLKIQVRDGVRTIEPWQIPDWADVTVALKADLPQDKALLYNIAMQAWTGGFISRETGWDLVGIEDKSKERERIDRELGERIQEEQMQAAEQQQAQLEQPPVVGNAAEAAGLPFAQNPQADNPVLDQMNAVQNAMENPMG